MLKSIAVTLLSVAHNEATARTSGYAGLFNALFTDRKTFEQTRLLAVVSGALLGAIK
jgi:hypothetical protein